MKPFPIPPQRGGTVQPEHVIGRSDIIVKLWKILEVTGFILFAERRFGKSSLIKKMAADSHDGFVTLYLQIESVNSGDALAEKILQKAKEDNLIPSTNYDKFQGLLDKIPITIRKAGTIELEARKMIWQSKIKTIIDEIIENNPDKKLVIFLDEFSLMLDKMTTAEAAQVVAYLRELAQESLSKQLRFTYSGSVGVDLILDKIRDDGHQIGPVLNHMEAIELNAFDEPTTCFFCQCLELGTSRTLTDEIRISNYRWYSLFH